MLAAQTETTTTTQPLMVQWRGPIFLFLAMVTALGIVSIIKSNQYDIIIIIIIIFWA